MAKELGATDTINSGTEDAIARVMELTNQRGVDCAIEAVELSSFGIFVKTLSKKADI